MKFLIIAHRFHTNLYYRAKALQDEGNEVKVVVLYEGRSEYKKGIEVVKISASGFSIFLSKLLNLFNKSRLKSNLELRLQSPGKELNKIMKSYKPEVIILKAFQNQLSIKTLKLARKTGAKVLMLTQTEKTDIKGSQRLFLKNINYFKRLGVFAYLTPIITNFEIFKAIGIENIHYLPFVFPFRDRKSNYDETIIKILSIGKYTKRKDHLLLIKAVHQLQAKGYKITLDIFGEKAEDNYYKLVQSYLKDLPEGLITLHQNISYESILQEYYKHHLYVLPSYAEPAAYSPVEAMAHGLPVICSDDCGTKCYINDGENGFIFKAKDLNDLSKKIEEAVKDSSRLKELSENACKTAKEKHDPSDFAKRIKEIIFQD